jgi:PIN domain nuclease of toxin-antitoxin system
MLVLDTHALVWLVNGSPRLGDRTKKLIDQAGRQNRIFVSAITPVEIGMLVTKGRLALSKDVLDWTNEALSRPGIVLIPLSPEIAIASTRLPGSPHGDPADKLIIASARHLGAPVVTADRKILTYSREGHLQAVNAEA